MIFNNKVFAGIVFWLYIFFLLFLVFFTPYRYRSFHPSYHLHWIPFENTLDGLKGPRGQHFWPYWISYVTNLAGNVLLFVPMGFLLKALYPRHTARRILGIALIISLVIELVQWAGRIGVGDIDDVLLNGAGAALGLALFAFSNNKARKRCNTETGQHEAEVKSKIEERF